MSRSVFRILQCLCEVESLGCSTLFIWVPAHVGVKGNKTVDSLVKQSLFKDSDDELIHLDKHECFSMSKDHLDQE